VSETLMAGLLGGVLAAAITLVGVLLTNRSRLAEDNIIKQRAEWRNSVRSIIAEAVNVENDADARRLWAELALRMNPDRDPRKDDAELVALVQNLEFAEGRTQTSRKRIVELASQILKHDWTRAKWEAQGWFWEDEPEQTRTAPALTVSKTHPSESSDFAEPAA
jgi:hypothetical protein